MISLLPGFYVSKMKYLDETEDFGEEGRNGLIEDVVCLHS